MRLHALKISNFRVIKSARIEFPDRVIGVVGPNGAGKSSIVEAIAWALYGNQAARSGKNEIKSTFSSPDETCEVTLDFSVNETRYRVIRRLVGRTERAEVALYRGDASESVGVNETRRYVGELLGLDWRGFLTSFLARQQELNALSDLQPSKRRDHLAGMLGIERLDKAIQRVKEEARLSGEKAIFIERQLGELGQVKTRQEELTKLVTVLDKKAGERGEAWEAAKKRLKEVSERLREMAQARSDWLRLTTQVEAERKTKENLTGLQRRLEEEHRALGAHEQEVKALDEQLVDFDKVMRRLEELKEARSRQTYREELTARLAEATRELEETAQKAADLRRISTRHDAVLRRIPEDVEEHRRQSEQRLNRAREEYSHQKAAAVAQEREIARLEKQFASINEFGPESVCDRCLRPLGDDLDKIKAHLNQELTQLVQVQAEHRQKLDALKTSGERVKAEHLAWEEKARDRYEASVKHASVAEELRTSEKAVAGLSGQVDRLRSRMRELVEITFDEKDYTTLLARQQEQESARSRRDQLRGSLARLPAVNENLEETLENLATVERAIADLTSKVQSLEFSEERYGQLETLLHRLQEDAEAARAEHVEVSKERDISRAELVSKEDQLKALEKGALELEGCREDQYYEEKLGTLFSEYRKHLIVRIKPTLAEISSGLIREMTDDRYGLVELDDLYNLRVMDSGQYFDVERFSGGEKDLANLCLRLAISLALSQAAGLNRSFIILDEVFGSQDTGRRELIVKALSRLSHRFPQILLITHIEEIKDQVEELIEVVPTSSGWSEIVVQNSDG
ncbi:MAG: SMC family ATPase [candidate division Zixibacteria bacterium]|nr:SMC family ATPase [candidate division Zixibacteria bacterium]